MVASNDNPTPDARPPTLEDLLDLCRRLNEAGAKYIVIGGMAIIQHGFVRATEDIDLLVDASAENFEKIKSACLALPIGAFRGIGLVDLNNYVFVREEADLVVTCIMSRSAF